MAVDDLWYLSKPGPDGKRQPSKRHGRGRRYRVRWVDDNGKQRTQLFDKKGEAGRFDVKVQSDLARGQYVDPQAGKQTLRAFGEEWLAAQTFDPSTREAVELRLRLHVYPVLGDKELRLLAQRPSIVQAWVRGLQEQIAPNYVRTVFANLSAVFNAATEDGLMTRNPCRVSSVKPPPPERKKVVPWLMERVFAVRDGLPARYANTVDAGFGLGLRQGEVFGLAVDDIDWLRLIVHVRRQVKYVGNRLMFGPPKGGKERDVPLSEPVSLRLAAHVSQFAPVAVELAWAKPGGKTATANLLFTGREKKAINKNYFNAHLWKPALVSAGVIPARPEGESYAESRKHGFHALRHSYASTMLADGVDIRTLAEYLGHSDPGFTLRTYTHLMPSGEHKARRALARAYDDTGQDSSVPQLYPVGL